ncbi:MAG TPA: c-type cytochrome [Steroidobacteraceae bacterium]|jgi:thiosulfate dehydrogenase|nr:c-type cytochrome [Burkholderiales bacterium]HXS21517.1 c-type cytochrome [Steroidobacteraceae bacterium]
MPQLAGRLAKIALLLLALGSLYAVALHKHAQREEIRKAAVALTPGCTEKLGRYGLAPGKKYASSYVMERTGARVELRGYSEEDVRAIERGCNIIDDSQGALATDPWRERWNAKRFIRGNHVSCDHCHRGIGDLQDASGNRLPGSNSLAASWTMGDMYDRFTGLLLPYEMRQMQCYINSSNGYKPNVADDVIRDVTAYSRFLSAALDLKIANHYEEQGIDEIPASATLKQGDDYIRGEVLYNEKCQGCHGLQGIGLEVNGKLVAPAVAGPNSWNLQSRNNFYFVSTILAGFICRNMPPGQESTLQHQDCRDIAFYISNLPRPAGDRQGPVVALQQQLLMRVLPPLLRLTESSPSKSAAPAAETRAQPVLGHAE